MGNGSSKKLAKVMKITGETLKVKTPVLCSEVVKDYPGYVLLESDLVKKYGVRAKPLELHQELEPKKIYFLVELPKLPVTVLLDKEEEEKNKKLPRRVRSASSVPPSLLNHMSAKDRLEFLMLTRRSNSNVSNKINIRSSGTSSPQPPATAAMQVKMRLPRAQLQKLIQENQDESELAEKIVNLCMQNSQVDNSDHDPDHRRPCP